MKTNYDGAMFGESDEAGIGVIIQNSDGEVMVTLSKKIQKPSYVEVLELLAVRQAMSFTLELGFINSTFEGDSKSVVKSLQGRGMENSQEGHLIKDIMSYVNSMLFFFSCCLEKYCNCSYLSPGSKTFFSFISLDGVCSTRYYIFSFCLIFQILDFFFFFYILFEEPNS